jgi:phosphotransferase system IIB component
MFKIKFIYIILSIITLGAYPYLVKKNLKNKPKNTLSIAKKITLSLENLIENLGGKENIEGAQYTHTKIKVFFINFELLNIEKLKKQKGISGVFFSSNTISLVVGNQAKLLTQLLIEKVS